MAEDNAAPLVRAAHEQEMSWRRIPLADCRPIGAPRLTVCRWVDPCRTPRELCATGLAGHYTVAFAAAATQFRCEKNGRVLHDGPVAPGMMQISSAMDEVRCTFDQPVNSLHIFVPEDVVDEDIRQLSRGEVAGGGLRDPECAADPALLSLAQALACGGEEDVCGTPYRDHLASAIVWRLVSAYAQVERRPRAPARTALLGWRLRRALDFLEANLGEAPTLGELAKAASLSPRYFAMQFHEALGVSPRKYLMRRRIERAIELLRSTKAPVVEIALATGFNSQAHFTTSFREATGVTPARWRRERMG
jgi:AraC-like DNA-binding protein